MAIAFVQSTQTGLAGASTAIAQAFGANVVADNLLVAAIGFDVGSGSTNLSTITDTVGSVWARARRHGPSAFLSELEVWYAVSAGSGANTVTAKWSTGAGQSNRVLLIAEYSGNATASPLGVVASSTQSSSNPASGAATPSSGGDLIVGALYDDDGSTSAWTAGAGFTIRAVSTVFAAAGALEDFTQGSAASTQALFLRASSGQSLVIMATFKAAAAVTGNATPWQGGLMGIQ